MPGWRRVLTLTAVTFDTSYLPRYLRAASDLDRTRPLITYYDGATGERVELSAETLINWVTKTTNLLVTDVGVEEGARVLLHLPLHWLAAVWVLSVDATGAELLTLPVAEAERPDVLAYGVDGEEHNDAEAVSHLVAPDRFAVSMRPMALPLGPQTPPDARDFISEVRTMPDQLVVPPDRPGDLAEKGTTRAEQLALRDGERVSVLAASAGLTRADYVDGLIAPLCAGGSVVWVRNPDPASLVSLWKSEQVSVVLGDVPEGVEVPEGLLRP